MLDFESVELGCIKSYIAFYCYLNIEGILSLSTTLGKHPIFTMSLLNKMSCFPLNLLMTVFYVNLN